MRTPGLGVLVVLHGPEAAASPAVSTVTDLLRPSEAAAVVVQDNTEGRVRPAAVPAGVTAYVARPDNPGLATAYEDAARLLSAQGVEWMLVLDQDTVVTRPYLDEVLDVTTGRRPVPPDISHLLPRLLDRGRVLSPHRRVRLRTRAVRAPVPGPATEWVSHLNSGSVLRLSSLAAAGGIPVGYPLDGLDHALAARLRLAGGRPWLLSSALEHRLSLLDRSTLTRGRLRTILDAEERIHAEFGSGGDRVWLAARRWLAVVLAATRVRSTPSLAVELRAARSATALAVRAARRGGP